MAGGGKRMLPNLSGLGAGARAATVTGEEYSDSLRSWEDRDDLVIGGCRADSDCYKEFTAALVAHVNREPGNNLTVVMLSVGAGVLELRALLEIERQAPGRIAQVLLIDPLQARDKADQVASKFAAAIRDPPPAIEYFCGEDAYTEALNLIGDQFVVQKAFHPAVIGAINYSLGMRAIGIPEELAKYRQAFTFVDACLAANSNLHVVTFFQNVENAFVSRSEHATDYIYREEKRILDVDNALMLISDQKYREELARLNAADEERQSKRAFWQSAS